MFSYHTLVLNVPRRWERAEAYVIFIIINNNPGRFQTANFTAWKRSCFFSFQSVWLSGLPQFPPSGHPSGIQEFPVKAGLAGQFPVGSGLDDPSLIENQDLIRMFHGF